MKSSVSCLNADVQLRQFPYPYRSMLAICSDLDGTTDKNVYLGIMRFLNTTEETAMGQGVGLEVGNSIHFRAKPERFSYWSTDNAGREMIKSLISSGHIDCLHSFGECVYTRDEAKQALDELIEQQCYLEVWVDHGSAITNFGPDIMAGHGDEVGHPAYHADLTIDYGIKYVCCGRGTSVVGQDVPPTLKGIFNLNHPIASGRTVCKEAAKQLLARIGNKKYTMHASNKLLRPSILRDGHKVYEFMRCNPHWGGVGSCAEGRYIGEVLTSDMLDRLIERGGTCILYTHLGRIDNPDAPFNEKAVSALRYLADEYHERRILVTTTRRLLGYCRVVREISYDTRRDEEILWINMSTRTANNWIGQLTSADLSGLTLYVPEPEKTHITIDGQETKNLCHNAPDNTGRPSVSLPWSILELPDIGL